MIRRKEKQQRAVRSAGIPLTIGVMPLEPGSGATQLSIMLANYLTAKERQHGVVVLQRGWQIGHLCQVLGCEAKESLVIKGIRFLAYEETKMARLMNEGYQFIVWCFEEPEGEQWEEFLRCHRHLVVCNLSEWHREKLEGFAEENRGLGGFGRWKFLSAFGPRERLKEMERKAGISIERIPWCPDPFSIKREWFSLLESLT